MTKHSPAAVRVIIVTAALALLSAFGASTSVLAESSADGWGTPVLVGSLDQMMPGDPDVAADADGNAVAVWSQADESLEMDLWTSRFVPGTGWSAPAALTYLDGDVERPCVGMDPGGNATVLWGQRATSYVSYSMWAMRYVAGVGWDVPHRLETFTSGVSHGLVVDRAGNATAVWVRYDGAWDVRASRYTAGADWSAPTTISSVAQQASWVRLSADAAGNVFVVWSQWDGVQWDIWANRYSTVTGWGVARLLEFSTNPAGSPDVAADAEGNALAMWEQSDGSTSVIWSSLYAPGTGWQDPVQVDPGVFGDKPRVAFDGNGNALAIWTKGDSVPTTDVWACRYVKGVGWGTPEILETGSAGGVFPGYYYSYDIGFDAANKAMAIWLQGDGTVYNLWACRYSPGTGWETPTLIEDYSAGDAGAPALAVDREGNATAVWVQGTIFGARLLSNRFVAADRLPPSLVLDSPSDGFSTANGTVTVTGRTDPGARLVVNGIMAAVSSDGSFSIVIALTQGANTITAVATDAAGNQAIVTRTVTYVQPQTDEDLEELQQELQETKDALESANARVDLLETLLPVALVLLAGALLALQIVLYRSVRKRLEERPLSPPPPPSGE